MNKRIISIQLLRALACLLVLVVHLASFNPLTNLQFGGGIGVDIFFIISGFIIAGSVEGLPAKRPIYTFLVNRFSRVVPYYYLLTLVYVTGVYVAFRVHASAGEFMRSFLFLPMGKDPVHPVGWSLNHEIFFYAFVAFALLLTRNMKRIATLFLLLLLVLQFVPLQLGIIKEIRASINLEFFLGMLIYLLRNKLLPHLRSLAWVGSAIVLLLVVMRLTLDQMTETSTGYYRDTVMLLIGAGIDLPRGLIYGIPSALLCLTVLAQEFRLQSFAKNNLLLRIGNASFTIYLIQHVFFTLLFRLEVSSLLLLTATFCLIVAVSLRLYLLEGYIARAVKERLLVSSG
ncbi:acyltransferase [Hymenobacter sp. BT664]|uniref:Acyltransferase n=1 Tax=Hymenobacter montanus TaxID=2771359 RepID=A0A927BGX4_9BACT|nr:acyltransferase [Hymenobacter montanus]MBD2769954.1 acyltransferase [Hymenobacter montanus]